jgi:hypothetical protein
MNQKKVFIFTMSAGCFAAIFVTFWMARRSVVGRWHQVGGSGEQMTFMDGGEMQVGISPSSYTWIDAEHLKVQFAFGSPRFIQFSRRDGDMRWTNHELGLVVPYTNEPGSFAKVMAGKALGF